MAFPVDAGRAVTNGTPAADPQVFNLPASIVSGDLLIGLMRTDNNTYDTFVGTGWTVLKNVANNDGGNDRTVVLYRLADGTEGATVSFGTVGTTKYAGMFWRITGAADPGTQLPELSADATGTSTTPNPTTVTPAGGAKDYLFLWLGGWEGEQTSPPAGSPTNYSNANGGDSGTVGAVASNCRVAGASRQLNAASEDPPSWTISASDNWTAWAMAIHPAGPAATSLLLPNPNARIIRPTRRTL